MRNIIIFVALLGAAAIFTVLYCLIAAGSQAEKKLTEIGYGFYIIAGIIVNCRANEIDTGD